jgi:hypothetical protein
MLGKYTEREIITGPLSLESSFSVRILLANKTAYRKCFPSLLLAELISGLPFQHLSNCRVFEMERLEI